ncbi:MAG: ELM1/GtrOC1 family putative glycosyltransferase [Hyphomicrobiaceae bacterium]
MIRILILGDGRLGHVHLSDGIAAAVQRRRPVTISRIDVSRGRWPGPVAALMTRSNLSSDRLLTTIYGLDPEDLPDVDLIISAGAETLAANICIARRLRAQNIFYGSLRQYRPSDFSLVLTSYRRAVRAANMVQTLKPSAFDPDDLPALQRGSVPQQLGLVIGGPTRGVVYRDAEWGQLAALLQRSHEDNGIRWVVSNSRRTPPEATARFQALAEPADGPVSALIDVDDTDAPGLPDLFAQVGGIVCTADSSSMISEAVWARRPLVTVAPEAFRLSLNEKAYRDWMIQNGWYAAHRLARLTPTVLVDALLALQPLKDNPLDALAELLEKHLQLPVVA